MNKQEVQTQTSLWWFTWSDISPELSVVIYCNNKQNLWKFLSVFYYKLQYKKSNCLMAFEFYNSFTNINKLLKKLNKKNRSLNICMFILVLLCFYSLHIWLFCIWIYKIYYSTKKFFLVEKYIKIYTNLFNTELVVMTMMLAKKKIAKYYNI